MTRALTSYVSGRWVAGNGTATPLVNPTTEETIATASSGGLDLRAALTYARDTGGTALREMTFAQRGKLLSEMAKAIHAQREQLLDMETDNGGNTRSDGKFDVDGATGTLAYYAKLGEQLGDRKTLLDGEAEQLGRSPRLVGRHVHAPRAGVAVLINAFNFPAWGMCEKAAAALLAGMPILSKPATSTALVAHRIGEILVEAKVLPAGAFSLLVGGAGDLLEHLDWQDVVAFTGGSTTGRAIRGNARVLDRGVRVGIEADSLNAALLGPDIEPDSDTWNLFIREVARDMTQKAGQKCTAIRRVFVTDAQLESARRELSEQLGAVKIGDPKQSDVKMGPLATAQQLRDITQGIGELKKHTKPVFGDGGRGGVAGNKGYFVAPTLLEASSLEAAGAVNEREVFGPVATLIPYDGTAAQAVRGLALGGGSLVSSVYSDDGNFAKAVVLGGAPYIGRLNLASDKVAEHSMGPGTVLPALTHGGPGRAGGGEELGGTRGMGFYMQRLAVQGYQPWLAELP
jgi:3,4-dehydroadipyl-CoA semialdehyde dehydrogenase